MLALLIDFFFFLQEPQHGMWVNYMFCIFIFFVFGFQYSISSNVRSKICLSMIILILTEIINLSFVYDFSQPKIIWAQSFVYQFFALLLYFVLKFCRHFHKQSLIKWVKITIKKILRVLLLVPEWTFPMMNFFTFLWNGNKSWFDIDLFINSSK